MTHSWGKPHEVGDRGQRYEVTYVDEHDNKRKVFGWSNTMTFAQAMVSSILAHPTWESPEVKDREAT